MIQLNWVTDMGVVKREQMRHKISAFFKRLRGKTVEERMWSILVVAPHTIGVAHANAAF